MSREEKKAQTRERILEAAGRGFRKGGFSGSGVDGLAKEAGVTSGAFYGHFGSKAEVFREALLLGLLELREAIEQLQSQHGDNWWKEFVNFYLGPKRTCDLAESCALQSLTSEVARSDRESRKVFEKEFKQIAKIISDGPKADGSPKTIDEALSALSTLIGAVTLARAVGSRAMSKQIASAALESLLPKA